MSIDRIVDKIQADARQEAALIVKESERKAEEVRAAAKQEAEKLAQNILREAERRANLEASRIITQARLGKKIAILVFKKGLIDRVLDQAFDKASKNRDRLRITVVSKDGETEVPFDESKLKDELRPRMERFIAEVLKI